MVNLFLPGPVDAGGRLVLAAVRPGDRRLIVELDGRHVRVLLVLAKHFRRSPDDELNDGPPFVPVSRIAEEFYDENELAAPPEEWTVRAYASQINRLIRKATPDGVEAPKVHETAKFLGYRLLDELEISTTKYK